MRLIETNAAILQHIECLKRDLKTLKQIIKQKRNKKYIKRDKNFSCYTLGILYHLNEIQTGIKKIADKKNKNDLKQLTKTVHKKITKHIMHEIKQTVKLASLS